MKIMKDEEGNLFLNCLPFMLFMCFMVNNMIKRFPPDFMFELSKEEFKNWRSQFVTSSWGINEK